MTHRIFIAVNLPGYIKDKFQEYQNKWYDLPVRWTKPDNLHITLVFIGYVSNDEMLEVCHAVKKTAPGHNPFSIRLKKILLGPPGKPPRMIWAEGEVSQEFAQLKDDLENNLLGSNSGFGKKEKRLSRVHITLARMRQEAWRDLQDKPDISENINLEFGVDRVEVMESRLARGGAEYTILESVELR